MARDHGQVDAVGERLAAGMDAQDRLATGEIGRRDDDLPVEAAGTKQRGVEILETVRGAHHDHLGRLVEAVELDEQLVQGLVVLAVEPAACTGGADRVELVDEDDRGRVLASLCEELANAGGAEAGEHLDEGGGALRVELGAGLLRDRLCEQRLARAGRPVEEDALRDAGAELLEALGVAEEVDDLAQLGLRLVDARDVLPRDGGGRAGLELRGPDIRHVLQRPPEEVDDRAEEDERKPRQRVAAKLMKKFP